MTQPSEWIIHGERIVNDSRRAVLSTADVELPDGTRFEQYVLRIPKAAIVLVLDGDRVPAVGTIDQENLVYLARSADRTVSTPDVNEPHGVP